MQGVPWPVPMVSAPSDPPVQGCQAPDTGWGHRVWSSRRSCGRSCPTAGEVASNPGEPYSTACRPVNWCAPSTRSPTTRAVGCPNSMAGGLCDPNPAKRAPTSERRPAQIVIDGVPTRAPARYPTHAIVAILALPRCGRHSLLLVAHGLLGSWWRWLTRWFPAPRGPSPTRDRR